MYSSATSAVHYFWEGGYKTQLLWKRKKGGEKLIKVYDVYPVYTIKLARQARS